MKKSYLLKSVFLCCFLVLGRWIIDNFLISEAKTQVQLSDDSYNCQGCKCGRPYEADVCTHWDVKFCCNMLQALDNEQIKDNLEVIGNYVIDDDLQHIDLSWDPISFSFEIQCVDAAGNKIDESNCNPATKPLSCDIPDVNSSDKYYTVKFDCNGWSNPPANQTFTVGWSQALNANTCTKTSYAFKWWSKTKWWAKAYDDQATVNPWGTVWSTVTLYAVWEYSPWTYTVKFNCKGWSNPPVDQTFTVGSSQALNANTCTRANYAFQWWSKTDWWTKDYDDKATVNPWGTAWSTVTLYAVWKRNLVPVDPDLHSCSDDCEWIDAAKACVKKSCFIAWTKVIMEDWSEKNIEDVQLWEKVLWAEWKYNTVLWFHNPKLWNKKLWSINGWKHFVTEEHPFMTTEWWKSLNPDLSMVDIHLEVWLLEVWDVLVTKNGFEEIKSLEWIDSDKDTQLYNLMLDWDHTYYADGYLVHNKQLALTMKADWTCPSPTQNRWWVCCPTNTWGKGNTCVPLCGEDDGWSTSTPTTTTYSWVCVDDSSQWSCYSRNSAYGNVPCSSKSTELDCYQCYVPKKESNGSRWSWGLPTRISQNWSDIYPATSVYNGKTWYRCCDWSSSVAKCKSSKWNIVSDSYCSLPKKDCTWFKENDPQQEVSWWGGGCFLEWTKILVWGWYKNIEQINVWDYVVSYNEEIWENEVKRVMKTFVHENNEDDLYELLLDWHVLKVTAPHRFYVLGNVLKWNCANPEWIPAKYLKVWDILLHADWNTVEIDWITSYPFVWTVYNFEVEDNHNYYVDDWYLVHNIKDTVMAETESNPSYDRLN